VNTLILIALMYAFDIGGLKPHYTYAKLNGVWRTAFAAGIPVILFAIYYRFTYLKVRPFSICSVILVFFSSTTASQISRCVPSPKRMG
jgi:hypothetical protein